MTLQKFIEQAIIEDIGDGDHTSLACIPKNTKGKAKILVKQSGIIAGIELSEKIYRQIDNNLKIEKNLEDGAKVSFGDIAMTIEGNTHAILQGERLVLNFMQRMSGIATKTRTMVDLLKGLNTKILDTRKTTPNLRYFEKLAVKIGGGENHRMGLYDMIMIKDNHIDFSGGIKNAITNAVNYIRNNDKILKIEIETRTLAELKEVLSIGQIDRIMLDNFSIEDLKQAIQLINGKYKTEASGGINESTIRKVAECGVDYISVGALTHQISSLDISMEAIK